MVQADNLMQTMSRLFGLLKQGQPGVDRADDSQKHGQQRTRTATASTIKWTGQGKTCPVVGDQLRRHRSEHFLDDFSETPAISV